MIVISKNLSNFRIKKTDNLTLTFQIGIEIDVVIFQLCHVTGNPHNILTSGELHAGEPYNSSHLTIKR